MINEILSYSVYGSIAISVIIYVFLILFNRNKEISSFNGFDTVKDMLFEYDKINIILGSGNFSYYNIKRRVIKLSKKDYYGQDVSSLSIGMMQAGISVNDDGKNKFINIFRSIIPTLGILDLLWILVLIVNYISVTVSDAKIGIVIISIVMIIHYSYIELLDNSYVFIDDTIKKLNGLKDKDSIINFVKKIIFCNKIQFISEIILIIRMVAIMLRM